MEWIERLNDAIDAIERDLTGEIDVERLARIACCSSYHFQRMFSYMVGIPLSEYVRRRRMSLAAVDLQSGDMKIIDVALKYGYSSPTAFNRAFQVVHGVAPSAIRDGGVSVKSFPPIRFTLTVKGVEEMNYRIEERDAFRIAGVSVPLHRDIEENFAVIPGKWDEVAADGTLNRRIALMDTQPMGVLGVCVCDDGEPWRYYIAAATSQENTGLEEYTVPAATWAIFPGSGPAASIQELEQRIVTEWLPTSGYEYGGSVDVEVYLNAEPEDMRFEVWIPVRKARA